MDETSLTLGWLVGRRIAGQRTKQKTVTGYSYNGTVLPKLPELEHPYAVIVTDASSPYAYLLCSSVPLKYEEYITWERLRATADGTQAVFACNSEWEQCAEDYFENRSGIAVYFNFTADAVAYARTKIYGDILWANYDVLNYSDDSLYLSASDPIPVYA
jgi:hypothetical protein